MRTQDRIRRTALSANEVHLIHRAESELWDASLRKALEIAVRNRGGLPSLYASPGSLADWLRSVPRGS